jgi:hypothetical protein
MRVQRVIAVATIAAFLFTSSAQSLFAADPHVVTSAQLHQAVQASHAKVAAARQAMDTFLARADVQRGIKRVGLEPTDVRQRVAMLSDTEIVKLHQQVMSIQQQHMAAGQDQGADQALMLILLLVIIAVVVAVVYWAVWYNSGYYYY